MSIYISRQTTINSFCRFSLYFVLQLLTSLSCVSLPRRYWSGLYS